MHWESRRQSCLKIDSLSGDGVLKVEISRVQEVSSIAGQAGETFERLTGEAVKRIADQRMPDGCQMDSDLMRAAGMEADLKHCSAGRASANAA